MQCPPYSSFMDGATFIRSCLCADPPDICVCGREGDHSICTTVYIIFRAMGMMVGYVISGKKLPTKV